MSISPYTRPLTLAERVNRALGKPAESSQQPSAPAERTCLILDTSYSMSEPCEAGQSKIDALRGIVASLTVRDVYAFSCAAERIDKCSIPDPSGNTNLHLAFTRAKKDKFTRAVIVTDGLPSDEPRALAAVAGLGVEIFYVGPAPKPAFLDKLAAAARKGSATHMATLKRSGKPALAAKVQRMLTDGK